MAGKSKVLEKTVEALSQVDFEEGSLHHLFLVKYTTYDMRGMWPEPVPLWAEMFDVEMERAAYEVNFFLKEPKVAAAVQMLRALAIERLHEEVSSYGIAVKAFRIKRLNSDWMALQEVRAAKQDHAMELKKAIVRLRAKLEDVEALLAAGESVELEREALLKEIADKEAYLVPGYETGLVNVMPKVIGTGEIAEKVVLSSIDRALLEQMRILENAAAQELDQLPKPNSNAGGGGTHTHKVYADVDISEV